MGTSRLTFDQKLLLVCAALGAALLWYGSVYLNARDALREVCEFVETVASKYPEYSDEAPHGLDEAYSRCLEEKAAANVGRPSN